MDIDLGSQIPRARRQQMRTFFFQSSPVGLFGAEEEREGKGREEKFSHSSFDSFDCRRRRARRNGSVEGIDRRAIPWPIPVRGMTRRHGQRGGQMVLQTKVRLSELLPFPVERGQDQGEVRRREFLLRSLRLLLDEQSMEIVHLLVPMRDVEVGGRGETLDDRFRKIFDSFIHLTRI